MSPRILPQHSEPPAPEGPVYLDAVLRPNRSLSRRGYQITLLSLAAACTVGGLMFWSIGAFPVAGFLGLDVLLLWLAFRASYRSGARERERVRVTAERIDVCRRGPRGQVARWAVSPHFARVVVDEPEARHPEIALQAAGESLPLARCLSPHERLGFAEALRTAIGRARQERHPAPATGAV